MCIACPHLGVYYTLSQVRNLTISNSEEEEEEEREILQCSCWSLWLLHNPGTLT